MNRTINKHTHKNHKQVYNAPHYNQLQDLADVKIVLC